VATHRYPGLEEILTAIFSIIIFRQKQRKSDKNGRDNRKCIGNHEPPWEQREQWYVESIPIDLISLIVCHFRE
jgi:hypothetical protein